MTWSMRRQSKRCPVRGSRVHTRLFKAESCAPVQAGRRPQLKGVAPSRRTGRQIGPWLMRLVIVSIAWPYDLPCESGPISIEKETRFTLG